MGKTASGAVWLDPNKTTPFDFYQYWRNVDDADVLKCIRMLTFLPLEQIDEMDKLGGQPAEPGQGDPGLRADQAGPRRGGGRQGPGRCPGPLRAAAADSDNMPTTELPRGQLYRRNDRRHRAAGGLRPVRLQRRGPPSDPAGRRGCQ